MIEKEFSGWVADAKRVHSPNFNTRPDRNDISLLVIHNISLPPGRFEGDYVEQFFTNRLNPQAHPYFDSIAALQVSAHFYIRRDGALVQFVNTFDRAWHAGVSDFQGRASCNDYSIGIEMAGADDVPYTDAQYARLSALTRLLMTYFPHITQDRIVGHSDIAPGRKTDPGAAFDWQRYYQDLTR